MKEPKKPNIRILYEGTVPKKAIKPKKFKSAIEMIEDMEREKKEHPIKDFFFTIQCKLTKWFWDNPRYFIQDIYCFFQRGKRGYSYKDCWSVDWYLAEILPKMLKQLQNNQHILPTWQVGESEEIAQERWDGYLNKMIKTFETANKIQNTDYLYIKSKEYDTEENKDFRNRMKHLDFLNIMTKQECEEYEEGWRLFQEYFFSLWD